MYHLELTPKSYELSETRAVFSPGPPILPYRLSITNNTILRLNIYFDGSYSFLPGDGMIGSKLWESSIPLRKIPWIHNPNPLVLSLSSNTLPLNPTRRLRRCWPHDLLVQWKANKLKWWVMPLGSLLNIGSSEYIWTQSHITIIVVKLILYNNTKKKKLLKCVAQSLHRNPLNWPSCIEKWSDTKCVTNGWWFLKQATTAVPFVCCVVALVTLSLCCTIQAWRKGAVMWKPFK
jgi:hypothetical protein